MKAWTIQPKDTWRTLGARGVWRPQWSFVHRDWNLAYRWMAQHLAARVAPRGKRIPPPVWVWLQFWGANRPRPDLRATGHLPPGTHGVRMELEIDERRVLASDFDLWHFVLNDGYLPESLADGDAFDARIESGGSRDPVVRAEIEASWQRIFDLDWYHAEMTHARGEKMIQGVMWELRREGVREVTEFVAR